MEQEGKEYKDKYYAKKIKNYVFIVVINKQYHLKWICFALKYVDYYI